MQQVVGRVRNVKYDIKQQRFPVRKAFSVLVFAIALFVLLSLNKISSSGETRKSKHVRQISFYKSTSRGGYKPCENFDFTRSSCL